jgi:hypothetical protein
MEEQDQTIQHLLIQVSAILKKYESIAEITGENFNVFKVLGLTTNEVRTHSAFLTELLNPAGSHGCKDTFLAIFIDQMWKKFYDDHKLIEDQMFIQRLKKFKPENAIAYSEYFIGLINESGEEGGRIDILIKDNENNAIIFENKIYAGDQKNQIVRYFNAFPNAPIFYLKLDGSAPKPESKGELKEGKEFICISYQNDIINWLEQCLKEAVNKPLLRETIRQYIYLIKVLTNQTTNNIMENEIASIISSSSKNIDSAFAIASCLPLVKKNIVLNFIETLKKSLGDGFIFDSIHGELFKDEAEFWFYKDKWEHSFVLTWSSDCENLEFGIYRRDDLPCNNSILKEKIQNKVAPLNIGTTLNFDNWLWNTQLQQWNGLSWSKVFNGKFTEEIKDYTTRILESIEGIEI